MKVLTLLRPENLSFVEILTQRGHDVWEMRDLCRLFRQANLPIQPFDVELEKGSTVADEMIKMCQALDRLHSSEKLDALVVWTDALPWTRAAVLYAKSLGIKTFEIMHGWMDTYMQGHFEHKSFVDCILAPGRNIEEFKRFYGQTVEVVPVGKPGWDGVTDHFIESCRLGGRAKFNIPTHRPVIMYATTWAHNYSVWEAENQWVESAVIDAHMNLQDVCKPFLIIKLHYATGTGEHAKTLRKLMDNQGIYDYAIMSGESRLAIPLADLVIGHKGGFLVEALLMDKPTIGFEFREKNDFKFWPNLGIEWVSERDKLMDTMATVLLDARVKKKMAEDRQMAKTYFNSENDCYAGERAVMAIEARVRCG